MLGGVFLCYEGFEKLAHKFLHSQDEVMVQQNQLRHAVADPEVDMLAFEKDKVKGAIRTDFILSAEIIAITLGTVALASFGKQVVVLSGIAILMTVGVYGLVAGIVKLDDAGLYLNQRSGQDLGSRLQRSLGRGILFTAPYMMKSLSVLGTAAMFMVGGGILTHGIHAAQAWIDQLALSFTASSGLLAALLPTFLNAIVGIIAGALALLLVSMTTRVWQALKS